MRPLEVDYNEPGATTWPSRPKRKKSSPCRSHLPPAHQRRADGSSLSAVTTTCPQPTSLSHSTVSCLQLHPIKPASLV